MMIRTFTGKMFDIAEPSSNLVAIEDIAHALSMICRFGGHARQFYSVAQHSVYVSQLVEPSVAMAALLHDAAEAYVGDMVTPLKQYMPGFVNAEKVIAKAIGRRFNVRLDEVGPEVKRADAEILAWEARFLMGVDATKEWGLPAPRLQLDAQVLVAWSPREAEEHFLARYFGLAQEYFRATMLAGGAYLAQ